MNRRNFLWQIGLATSGTFLAFSGFQRRAEGFIENGNLTNLRAPGYGELLPTAAKNTGETYLALPKGFEYNVFGKVGDRMADGQITPRAHDAMATFRVQGELRIVR